MAATSQKISVKGALKYALLPEIIPRAKALGSSGFGYLAFLFACVYRSVRILPPNHPYVNPANIGKFGIIKVIAAASNNLKMGWKNADQIIVFLALIAAVILMVMQFILLILAFVSGKAFAGAGGAPFTSMFETPNPATDVAFLLLDYVFGIPGAGGGGSAFFESNALNATGGPSPFHIGLHALFNFYNLAILLVAVLIFMYYIVVVVIETAQTGVPFGSRFSKIYAPFRLVIAVGLLVPLNYGFNGSQYITLYAAKIGSSFATNGWILYNETLQNPTGGANSELVARPRAPAIDELVYFSTVYHACREMYRLWVPTYEGNVRGSTGVDIQPYVIVDGTAQDFLGYSYSDAKKYFKKQDVEVVLGELNTTKNTSFAGSVRPYCGKITISLSNDNPSFYSSNPTVSPTTIQASGIRRVENAYYIFIRDLLNPAGINATTFTALGERIARANVPSIPNGACHKSDVLNDAGTCGKGSVETLSAIFTNDLSDFRRDIDVEIANAYSDFTSTAVGSGLDLALPQELKDRGWGGAGIWYNHIADINGGLASTVYATPSIKSYPEVMEYIRSEKLKQDSSDSICELFEPNQSGGRPIPWKTGYDDEIGISLNEAYRYFACQKPNQETGAPVASAGSTTSGCSGAAYDGVLVTRAVGNASEPNPIISVMSLVFGINGLFDLRTASCWDNALGRPSVNPLAQMSLLGRSLVENAIRSMGIAVGASFGGGILGAIDQTKSFGAALQAASGMFVGIATIGLTAGFILFYILPFLPFIYFFFAVGAWVKSIFEAMVGAPLWALAHLHIDGDGLPGKAALSGYYLIFEIFLRPIVIVFGLIAGVATFTALAGILNNIFDLVVLNTSGALPGGSTAVIATSAVDSFRRGVVDQFFFTIMYAILLYMMATASFKLVDTIPAHVTNWLGSGVPTFNDNKQDPTQGLTQYAAIGGQQVSSQVLGGIQQGLSGAGGLVGSVGNSLINPKQ